MKHIFRHLLLWTLLFSVLLTFSACSSTFPLPKDTSPVLKIPYDRLDVDWDKAISDAIAEFCESRSVIDINIEKEDDALFFTLVRYYDPGNLDSSDNYFPPYSALIDANNLLRILNQKAKEQDDRISDSGLFSYGGIYDVMDVSFTARSKKTQTKVIDDTLTAGEHRKRGLIIKTTPISVDLFETGYMFSDCVADLYNSKFSRPSFIGGLGVAVNPFFDDYPLCNISIHLKEEEINEKNIQAAASYGEKLLRTFNRFCQKQDPRIANPSDKSYGGAFDAFGICLSVDYEDNVYYKMEFKPGEYGKIQDYRVE